MLELGSTPSITEFDPTVIPFQFNVINDIRENYDYSMGVHEVLLSGSIGSSKSLLMAHLALTHCLKYPRSRVILCRQSMPDLKDTILQKVLDHLDGTEGLEQEKHWQHNQTRAKINFSNGSEILSRSWADQKFKKFRSIEASMAIIEELTENGERYEPFYGELKNRIGRLPHVKENVIVAATNPDSPLTYWYKYFILGQSPTRHVYYSLTRDNPFLPKQYLAQLERDMDPKLARRMLMGEWIEIQSEGVYYQYSRENNFKNETYKLVKNMPIIISHDFNIATNKPMSACLMQKVGDTFHVFSEVILDTARTQDVYEELASRGILDLEHAFIIHGDASGKHRDTRNIKSDYDIIRSFLSNYRKKNGVGVRFDIDVPLSNPAIRTRHNRLNAYCQSSDKRIRLYVYKEAPTVDEGMRLTTLKKNSYIEDDSKRFQHVTTSLGYAIMSQTEEKSEMREINTWQTLKF